MKLKSIVNLIFEAIIVLTLASSVGYAAQGDTLATVKARGKLLCTGHNGSYYGFAEIDDKGAWRGLDVELCKALATTIFGTPDKLEIVPVSWAQRFPALKSGDIDAIIKVTGWTQSRDTDVGVQFSMPYFLGITQLIAHKETGAKEAKDLAGGTICVAGGTSTEQQVTSYFKDLKVDVKMVTYENTNEMEASYYANRCDGLAGWGPNLAIRKSKAKDPDAQILLPDKLALEPQSIAVRQGDDQWLDVINWMLSALLTAEQYGVTQENVDEIRKNPPNPVVGRLLGVTPGVGKRLGLDDDWAYNVIKKVGNYKEIYDRTLGDKSPYKYPRGINALWNQGGVLYPMIFD